MEFDVTVAMALVDYVPVLLMGVAAVILLKDFYGRMSAAAFACFAAGEVNVFIAGFLKATWKLLYGAGVCHFEVLNNMMMPVQSLGFLLAAVGLLMYVSASRRKKNEVVLRSVPPVFGGTLLFVPMMVVGLGTMCVSLSVLAVRKKRGVAVVFFVLCFFCYLCMGYLSSRDSTSAAVNWIDQSVNCLGQGCFLAGVLLSRRKGVYPT